MCGRTAADCNARTPGRNQAQNLSSESSRSSSYFQFIIKDTFQEKPKGRDAQNKVWGWGLPSPLWVHYPPSSSMGSPSRSSTAGFLDTNLANALPSTAKL